MPNNRLIKILSNRSDKDQKNIILLDKKMQLTIGLLLQWLNNETFTLEKTARALDAHASFTEPLFMRHLYWGQ